MGKSPGKWIKTVLFGRKTSKSGFPKNASAWKNASSDAKAPPGVLAMDRPVIADLPPQSGEKIELERGCSANLSSDAVFLSGKQGGDTEGAVGLNSVNDGEIIRQEQAATKAQAAFRGYLARRAFRALKGIIRLQALIRGHLVRRQAIATLRCMQAIIKFQAVVRGRRVRLSDAGCELFKQCRSTESTEREQLELISVNTFLRSEKLSRSAFVAKLVASSPTVMALSLQYDLVEPNSAWNWLERWSSSRFWEPLARPKKSLKSKHHKKQANMQTLEKETGRPKRGVQRVPALNGDSNPLHASAEHEKPKRKQRKALNHQTEAVQEHPQNELEKVKRSLKKVSVSGEDASDKSEVVTEKPQQRSGKKMLSSPATDVSEQGIDNSISEQGMDNSSKKTSNPILAVSEQHVEEPPLESLVVDEPVEMPHNDVEVPHDHPTVELLSSESGEREVMNSDNVNEELSPKEDQPMENQRTTRRKSFPVKQEYPENVSQNSPSLPSYMAATASAKAKLRAQGSPRFAQDGADFVRRLSLPSPTNGKLSSLSPRIQKPVGQANGKGGIKTDKALLSPRDGNEKVVQPGWKR